MKLIIYIVAFVIAFFDLLTIVALKFIRYNTLVSQKYEEIDYSEQISRIEYFINVCYIVMVAVVVTIILTAIIRMEKNE